MRENLAKLCQKAQVCLKTRKESNENIRIFAYKTKVFWTYPNSLNERYKLDNYSLRYSGINP